MQLTGLSITDSGACLRWQSVVLLTECAHRHERSRRSLAIELEACGDLGEAEPEAGTPCAQQLGLKRIMPAPIYHAPLEDNPVIAAGMRKLSS